MFEESFIPPGLRDFITIFTTIVALITILQVLRLHRIFSAVPNSEERRRFLIIFQWTLIFTFFSHVLTALLIWVTHALLGLVATEGIKGMTIIFGCIFSASAGIFLGMLANFSVKSHISPHISTHLAFGISILLCVCLLGTMAWFWSETSIGWMSIVEEMWPAAVVTSVGIIGYLIKGKPWESSKS